MTEQAFWPGENPITFNRKDFDNFLKWCSEQGASDILIEAGEVLGMILNGYVRDVGRKILRYEEIAHVLSEIYQPAAQSMLKSGKELNFQYSILTDSDRILRYRVNVTSVQAGEGGEHSAEIVLRTIPEIVPHYSDLDIPEEVIKAMGAEYGIVLVAGPTGSGKSTTIAAAFREIIETRPININTYESPIEFDLKSIPNRKARVKQTEIPSGLPDYKTAVENSLRRAQKVVLFGEAKSKDIFVACIREAETGHMVFTTVHANDVPATISRIVGEFSGEETRAIEGKLAGTLRMILCQRLYSKLGGGRVAVREYMIFDEKKRRHLQMAAMKHGGLKEAIAEMVQTDGVPMLSDAKRLFRTGLLPLGEYATIVNEVGSVDDLRIVPEVASELHERGVIARELYDEWIIEYNQVIGE